MSTNNIEIEILRRKTKISNEEIKILAITYINSLKKIKHIIRCDGIQDSNISEQIEGIVLSSNAKLPIDMDRSTIYVYNVSEETAEIETLESNDEYDEVSASSHWILPNREFQEQWEHLIYEKGLKENILQFAKSVMLFSQKNVNPNIISCNKLVLLHGPPGTGKTSLCQSLAQKLAIHSQDKFQYTHLFEINSHSLFSKWFSESGKLVLKLFSNIREVAEHKQSLVIILIDEVESIAYARDSVSANEPSDSLRVVNAVLTQLDRLRKFPNILVLTTSNLTSTIDFAFVDRADLKQYIGEPSVAAIYDIYVTAIQELASVHIISTNSCLFYSFDEITADALKTNGATKEEDMEIFLCSKKLLEISKTSHGLSGRSLRKLPLLAHAWFVHADQVTLNEYLTALANAVEKHFSDMDKMHSKKIKM